MVGLSHARRLAVGKGVGIMKKAVAAAAAALVATSALSGAAAAVPGVATEKERGDAVHTKRFVLHEIASNQLGERTFAGSDKVRSRSSGKLVGFDSYTGKFYPRQDKVVLDVGMALKGGIIVGRVKITDFDSNRFKGRILKGSGKYAGIEGTVTGRQGGQLGEKTYLTLRYHL